ncbi:MAG: tRNA pseudouridine(55) synthase TruB [Rikenellaceae bacterium]|nr:tRNA pseudouridine(55) synthase TruB [Rikenellaceae bacterium]MCL2692201.1 tRNA pseudouridine(55) synthase TruB [Rikenellaceae bacterium]
MTGINLEEGYVLSVDKPYGWTSTDVVRKVKFGLQRAGHRKLKVGHAGTLDPLATGVLLICLGRATKRVEELQAETKEYVTELMFGATTPSYDLEHEIDRTFPYEHITHEMLERAATELCGERLQTPPAYSAKKIDGLRAYEYAREGAEVEMKRATVHIHAIEVLEFTPPRARLRIECGKGTYIRSIAMELGELLGSGAHLVSLRRTRSGDFAAAEGLSIEDVENFLLRVKQNRDSYV